MRHLIAAAVALSALGCNASPGAPTGSTGSQGGSGGGGSSSGAGSSGTASGGTSGGSSGSTGAGTTGGSSGGSTGNDCGADTCVACPGGYVSADDCLNGGWQCACALAPTGGGSSGGGSGTGGNSGGGTTGASCGPNTCGVCGAGCVNSDTCQPGGWLCGCSCSGIGGVNGGTSGGSSAGNGTGGTGGTSGGTPTCNLDGGAPTLVGSWAGTGSATVTFQNNGGGGGGPDTETVTATDGGVAFDPFFSLDLATCTLPWTLTGATSASVVPASVCTDLAKGHWTFQSGTATLDATGCVMTVQTAGTLVDPGSGAGTFTTSATLNLQ
jgi:hypothetical protein